MMKLGLHPPKKDIRTLRMLRYLPARLPAPPASIDHQRKVTNWPMYANDVLSDCGPAGAAHQIESWSQYAGRARKTLTDTQVKTAYFAMTDGQDTGVYLLDMMKFWRDTGIGGDKIEAFVSVNPSLDEVRLGIQLFGSVGLGLALPDVGTFGPWTKTYGIPNPYNGHYVCAVGYDDATKLIDVVTWGKVQPMAYSFLLKYCDEAYAALNDIAFNAYGLSPEGFDMVSLQSDLAHLGDPVLPPAPPVVAVTLKQAVITLTNGTVMTFKAGV